MARHRNNALIYTGLAAGLVGLGYYIWRRKIPRPIRPVIKVLNTEPELSDSDVLFRAMFG